MKFFVGWKVSPVTTHSILVPIQIKILMQNFLNRTLPTMWRAQLYDFSMITDQLPCKLNI